MNIACMDPFISIFIFQKKHLYHQESQLSSKSPCNLDLLAKINLLLEWCGNRCMSRCCRFTDIPLKDHKSAILVPLGAINHTIMPSICFLFSLPCYMDYFSFLVVDEVILIVSSLNAYICLQVTTFCPNVFCKYV